MEKKISGLVFRKIDLHVHTPASKCYDDKSITPEQIVKEAMDKGLDAIAVTDHNTGEWIDKLKQASKNKIVVFPGVEISATGGKRGTVHIIGIFDQSKTTKDIENFLGDLKIKAEKYGKEEAFSEYSPNQVINKITEHGGLPIIAHANSEQGVIGGMQGNPRKEIIQNQNLIAIETTDYDSEEKKQQKKRVIDVLATFYLSNRKLAVYQASDNPSKIHAGKHSLDGIGSRYTYFKLDEISFEGLRQCFCDPDVRIKQQNELEIMHFPKITHLELSQGFLKNQKIDFHRGLNCIVGGKGVGKSLLIEFIRFGLNQTSSDQSIAKDHLDKLSKRLDLSGKVTVQFELKNGEKYSVIRTYDNINNRIECSKLSTNEPYDGEISVLFPILAYSQNEVIKIAENENAQLRLIDSFIDSEKYSSEIKEIVKQLSKYDKELAKSLKASADVASYKKELSTIEEQIKNIDVSLKNKLFDEMKKWEIKKKMLQSFVSYHDEIINKIDDIILNFADEIRKPEISKELIDDIELKKAGKFSEESHKKVTDSLNGIKTEISKNKTNIEQISAKWNPEFEKKQKEYESMLEKAGGDKRKLEGDRRILEANKQKIEKELEKHTKQLEKLDKIKKDRDSLINKLEEEYNEYYKARKEKFETLTMLSNGKLKLELIHAENREEFKESLLGLKKGSHIREADIDRISQKLMPREFVDFVINNDIDSLSKRANLAEENAKKLIEVMNSKEAFEDVLELSYNVYPGDVPSIKFRKDDGEYYPLSELSVGQKCTALLIIALSEGERPIIIDQPEDSLDNPSVYEDVVSKLRFGKEKRQFILTTHNSSVGVASDSDNFIVFNSSANQANVKCCGAIDRNNVRSEIIQQLEGGSTPYELKSKKYNIKNV